MEVNSFAKPLAMAAGVLGIVQGVAWYILSLMAILIHVEAWVPSFDVDWFLRHSEARNFAVASFFVGDYSFSELFLGPKQYFRWAFVYLVLSTAWLFISVAIFQARKSTNYRKRTKIYLAWAGCTAVVCICDLVLTCLLFSDYKDYVRSLDMIPIQLKGFFVYTVIGCGILMTIAAKGFALWIVNLVFAVLIWKQSRLFAKEN